MEQKYTSCKNQSQNQFDVDFDDWANFINSQHCLLSNKNQIRSKIYHRVPMQFKKEFWFKLINLQSYINQKMANTKSFDQLSKIQPIDRICIQKDIPRTIVTEQNKKYQIPLTKLVNAFCNKFPKVGYHSGMTFFMLRLLQVLSDQEAFWILSYIFQNDSFNQQKIFSKNVGVGWIDQFENELNQNLKKINQKCWQTFQSSGLQFRMLCIVWLKTFFLYKIPISLSYKIWQLYLLQGPKIWLFSSMSIISQIYQAYLKQKDISEQDLLLSILRIYGSLEDKITPQTQYSIMSIIEKLLIQDKNKSYLKSK